MLIEFFITLALGIVAAGAVYGMRSFLERRRALSVRAFTLSTRAADRIVFGMVALSIVMFSALTVLRYLSFNAHHDHQRPPLTPVRQCTAPFQN